MEKQVMWHGRWVWALSEVHSDTTKSHELVYFRRTFDVPDNEADEVKHQLTLHITADSRYRLFVNGVSASVGPAKGDLNTHYYETVDVSSLLRIGKNVLAVQVLHFAASEPFQIAESGPMSMWRSQSGALLVEGTLMTSEGTPLEALHTDERWLCMPHAGYEWVPDRLIQWIGGSERVKASATPHGWTDPGYDDSAWKPVTDVAHVVSPYGELTPWQLAKRPIPPLYEREAGFHSVTKVEGISTETAETWIRGESEVEVPAHQFIAIELDAAELTTAYLTLYTSGGTGAVARLLTSEGYEPLDSDAFLHRRKGVRDDASGKLVGPCDEVWLSGTSDVAKEVYEPFWFRTFRFVRLEVKTAAAPLILRGLRFRETGYPLDVQATFECSDADLNQVWEQSIRTLRRCMHETYEDCPFYEQLQYTMDTRLQMLFTYLVSADDRLAKRTLFDYHSSQLPNGMLQSRYPSVLRQVIPSFGLYFIDMLFEYYWHFGDVELVKRYRPTMLALLDWFERHRNADGMVGTMPAEYWNFFDWVAGWPTGVPPWSREKPVTMLSFMLASRLKKASELLLATGWPDVAKELSLRASEVCQVAVSQTWSEERGLFRDGPDVESYSQHTQVWAVLAGAMSPSDARNLMERTISDESLDVASLPTTYSVLQALYDVGMDEAAFGLWDRWRVFADLHLTTLPEEAIPAPRSDCHAWSAVALAAFPMWVLGVTADAPGMGRIRIKPRRAGLHYARGRVATAQGAVDVAWHIQDKMFYLEVTVPPGVEASVEMPDLSQHSIHGTVQLSCPHR